MPILLEIPAQEQTGNESRIAALTHCDRQGYMKFEAFDKKSPRIFTLRPGCVFPWKSFFLKLRIAWFRSANNDIPFMFRLQRKIDEQLLDEIALQPEENLPQVFAALRKAGYFCALPK